MATSSIFDKFVIDSDEKLEILLKPVMEKEKYNAPKIDLEKEMAKGEKILEKMQYCCSSFSSKNYLRFNYKGIKDFFQKEEAKND